MFRKSLLGASALVLCVSTASAGQKVDPPLNGFVPRWMNFGVPAQVVNGFPVTMMPGKRHTAPVHNSGLPKYAHAIFDNIAWRYLDTNAAFISWYGFGILAEHSCYAQHYCVSETEKQAIAFHGTGKKATKIGVAGTGGDVGIYGATASGLPGNSELAGGSCTASSSGLCWVDVNIYLKKGQEYFLEVSCGQAECDGVWDAEDADFSGDAVEYVKLNSEPWRESTLYPAEGAGIIL